MINLESVSIMIPMTGGLHSSIRLQAGRETPESKKVKQERNLQDTKRVQPTSPIYNSRGKIIDTRYWEGLPLAHNSEGEVVNTRYGENIDLSV